MLGSLFLIIAGMDLGMDQLTSKVTSKKDGKDQEAIQSGSRIPHKSDLFQGAIPVMSPWSSFQSLMVHGMQELKWTSQLILSCN